jgi:hypothetical protein
MNNKDTRELNIHVYMLLEEKWKGRTMQTIENLIHIPANAVTSIKQSRVLKCHLCLVLS